MPERHYVFFGTPQQPGMRQNVSGSTMHSAKSEFRPSLPAGTEVSSLPADLDQVVLGAFVRMITDV
jgi:hypothetical protein